MFELSTEQCLNILTCSFLIINILAKRKMVATRYWMLTNTNFPASNRNVSYKLIVVLLDWLDQMPPCFKVQDGAKKATRSSRRRCGWKGNQICKEDLSYLAKHSRVSTCLNTTCLNMFQRILCKQDCKIWATWPAKHSRVSTCLNTTCLNMFKHILCKQDCKIWTTWPAKHSRVSTCLNTTWLNMFKHILRKQACKIWATWPAKHSRVSTCLNTTCLNMFKHILCKQDCKIWATWPNTRASAHV